MLKYKYLSIIGLTFALSACTSSFQSTSTMSKFDDIYYSPKDKPIPTPKEVADLPIEPSTEYVQEGSKVGTESNSPNYNTTSDFNYDNYYDYEYAARLRRFHGPTVGMGMGYYDPYFVDPFFYNRNPAFIGGSIYDPFFGSMGGWNVGIGVGFGMGYNSWGYGGYNSWGYNPWGYNNYMMGYNHGYNNGFNNGYFNNNYAGGGYYDGGRTNNRYYAPRGSNINSPYQSAGGRNTSGNAPRPSGRSANPTNTAAPNAPSNVRSTTNTTAQPATTRPSSGSARPSVQPSNDAQPSQLEPSQVETPVIINQTPVRSVPNNATSVPNTETRPTRSSSPTNNTYSRPSRGGNYNQSTPAQTRPAQTRPTQTRPTQTRPAQSAPSYNSTPSYNRSSGGSSGGSRSNSPRR